MLTRKKILANVQDCSVEDLVEAVLNKTVTMYELKSCGLLPKQQKLVQNALKDIREGHISSNHVNDVNDDFPSEITVDNGPTTLKSLQLLSQSITSRLTYLSSLFPLKVG